MFKEMTFSDAKAALDFTKELIKIRREYFESFEGNIEDDSAFSNLKKLENRLHDSLSKKIKSLIKEVELSGD